MREAGGQKEKRVQIYRDSSLKPSLDSLSAKHARCAGADDDGKTIRHWQQNNTMKQKMESPGIDPGASRMLSERSTI